MEFWWKFFGDGECDVVGFELLGQFFIIITCTHNFLPALDAKFREQTPKL